MVGSKFNIFVGAAILASTVCFLWIKMKRKRKYKKVDYQTHNCDQKIECHVDNESLILAVNNNEIITEEINLNDSRQVVLEDAPVVEFNLVKKPFIDETHNQSFEKIPSLELQSKDVFSIKSSAVQNEANYKSNEKREEIAVKSGDIEHDSDMEILDVTNNLLNETDGSPIKIDDNDTVDRPIIKAEETDVIVPSINNFDDTEILDDNSLSTGNILLDEEKRNSDHLNVDVNTCISDSEEIFPANCDIIEKDETVYSNEGPVTAENVNSSINFGEEKLYERHADVDQLNAKVVVEEVEELSLIKEEIQSVIKESIEDICRIVVNSACNIGVNDQDQVESSNDLHIENHDQSESNTEVMELVSDDLVDEVYPVSSIESKIDEIPIEGSIDKNIDIIDNNEEVPKSNENEVILENIETSSDLTIDDMGVEIVASCCDDDNVLPTLIDQETVINNNNSEEQDEKEKDIVENIDQNTIEVEVESICQEISYAAPDIEQTHQVIDEDIQLISGDKESEKEACVENTDTVVISDDYKEQEREIETEVTNCTQTSLEQVIDLASDQEEKQLSEENDKIPENIDCVVEIDVNIDSSISLEDTISLEDEIIDHNKLTRDVVYETETPKSTETLKDTSNFNFTKNKTDTDSNSDISQTSDYRNDSPLDELLINGTLMDYIEDCLNDKGSNGEDVESTGKLENWPNDEDSLNNIKRDFYEPSTNICSPHPSSESDHAHCVNNLTERVAILSAESILDSNFPAHSSDSEMTPTLSSPTFDDSNPELYVEKITYDGKELDIVYFEEALLEEGGIQTDIKIIRTIPVGLGGRIIGKKGKTKNELMKKFGAQLLIYNHPMEFGKQILEITCSPSVSSQLEKWVNKTLDQITKSTIQTTVSNPEWLKPMIPLGRMVAAHIVDMSTIQHVKLRIFDPVQIKMFNNMQQQMNLDYNGCDNTSLLPRPVAIGCICVAMVRPDCFLRAEIVDLQDDIVWVYLLDIGKLCQTYLFYLFKIREKYMRVPYQVIPARIPHGSIKNCNISPAVIHRRFLCDQTTMKPKLVRVFFSRMNTCCEPCVNIYVPMTTVCPPSASVQCPTNNGQGDTYDEFVDLLELLVSMDVCTMVRETVDPELQVQLNTNHFKAFLTDKEKKQSSKSEVPVYFQPCNNKFYEDFIEFKSEINDANKIESDHNQSK